MVAMNDMMKSAMTTSSAAEAVIVWPSAHLKEVTGGKSGPNTRRNAAASEASDARVPLP